jgi:hypothetical protein
MEDKTLDQALTPEQRRYIVGETAVSVVINSLLSLGFALGVSHGLRSMPLWGVPGMAFDFIPQVFMITFATTLAVTLATRARLRRNRVSPICRPLAGALGRAPKLALVRALVFSAAAVLVVAPLSIAALRALGITSLAPVSFVAFKVIYGAALAATLAPFIAKAALAHPAPTVAGAL